MPKLTSFLRTLVVLLVAFAYVACGGGSAKRIEHPELAFSVALAQGWGEPALAAEVSGTWYTALKVQRKGGAENQFGTLRVEVMPGAAQMTADAQADRMLASKRRALPGLHYQRLDPLETKVGPMATWEALMQVGEAPYRARCWVLASPQGVYAVHLEGAVEFEGLLPAAESVVRSFLLEDPSEMLAMPTCERCNGTGQLRLTCPTCDGTGYQETRGIFGMKNVLRCLQCNGAGGVIVDCPH